MRSDARYGQNRPMGPDERRRQPRFVPARGDAFAFLGLDVVVAGPILNIGQGGLAVRYVAGRKMTEGVELLDIFVDKGDFRLERIPCQIVWDSANSRDLSLGPFSVRHCGIEFRDMTHEKASDLLASKFEAWVLAILAVIGCSWSLDWVSLYVPETLRNRRQRSVLDGVNIPSI